MPTSFQRIRAIQLLPYIACAALSLLFGCAASGSMRKHFAIGRETLNFGKVALVLDICIEDPPPASNPAIDLAKNAQVGQALVDSIKAKLDRKGYPLCTVFPPLIASRPHKDFDVIRDLAGRDTLFTKSTPLYVPDAYRRDSLVSRAQASMWRYQHTPPSPADTSPPGMPLTAIFYVNAFGRDVPTGKALSDFLVDVATLGISKPVQAYYSVSLDVFDVDTGRRIDSDATFPEKRSASLENFLEAIDQILDELPNKSRQ